MFRPTSALALLGVVVLGIIIADFVVHPEGTKAVANGLVNVEKPAANALLGQSS